MVAHGAGFQTSENFKVDAHNCRKKVLKTTIAENSHYYSESIYLTSLFVSFYHAQCSYFLTVLTEYI